MFGVRIVVTLLSLGICTFAPGFLVVRRLPWQPLEKICGAVAASLILLYLIAWAVFCFAPGTETGIYRAAGCVAVGIAIWRWGEIRDVVRSFGAKQTLAGFGFLLVWSLVALAIIRNYSGALWSGDWVEHFQRTLFFLHHFPVHTDILGGYVLPARPPMMNVLAAFFLGQITDQFEVFQIVFTFLNLLTFLACCLLLPALVKSRKSRYLTLTALFALNPMLMQNAWYSWTKLLAVFFVVTGLAFYLAGLRKNDSLRIVTAFVCLAAALLVHYSAGPYVVFVAGHYILRMFPHRPNKVRELAAIGVCSGLLLATWFGWSLRTYGSHTTFASNTSVTSAQKYQGSAIMRIGGNMLATLVPAIVRDPDALDVFDQPNKLGGIRDNAFIIYQANLIFAMGLFGGPLVIYLLYRVFRRGKRGGIERGFWLAFIPSMFVVGIAVVGESDPLGSAHVTLAPLIALGVTLLAATFPWGRAIAMLLLAGCIVDFSLGIFLQTRVEHLENTPQKTIFDTGIKLDNRGTRVGEMGPDSLSGSAWMNWFSKHRGVLQTQWIRQLSELPQTPFTRNAVAGFKASFNENVRNFGGWYERHGGEIRFLGDDFAGLSLGVVDAPSVALLLMFFGLIFRLGKESMRLAPVQALPAQPVKKKVRGGS
jgi:hypothetical protein